MRRPCCAWASQDSTAASRLSWSHLWSHSCKFSGVRDGLRTFTSGATEPNRTCLKHQPQNSKAREVRAFARSIPAATASLTRPTRRNLGAGGCGFGRQYRPTLMGKNSQRNSYANWNSLTGSTPIRWLLISVDGTAIPIRSSLGRASVARAGQSTQRTPLGVAGRALGDVAPEPDLRPLPRLAHRDVEVGSEPHR
jgi:hypothetical protein